MAARRDGGTAAARRGTGTPVDPVAPTPSGGTRTSRRASTRTVRAGGGRRLGRVVLPVVLVVLTLVVLGAGVFPTRTYLDKQAELADTRERLAELEAANAEAEARRDLLNTDAEIERLARDQLGLARPGEETYVVLPAPQPPVEVPDGWPFDHVGPVLADG